MAESIEDQLVSYLKDAHALEQMSLQMTEAAAKATDDPKLHELFQHHHEETQEHERLIRERMEAHARAPPSSRTSARASPRSARAWARWLPRTRQDVSCATATCRNRPRSRRTSCSAASRSARATRRAPTLGGGSWRRARDRRQARGYLGPREVASRESHGGESRIKAARFPARKTLEEFDFTFQRSVRRQVVEHLGQLDFLHAKENVVLLGPPGTGKSHLAIAISIRACLAGHRVAFATATEWVARLGDAKRQGNLEAELKRLGFVPLIVVDEVGYIPSIPRRPT